MKVSFFLADSEWVFSREEGGLTGLRPAEFADAFQAERALAPLRGEESALRALRRFIVRDIGMRRMEGRSSREMLSWLAVQIAYGSLEFECNASPKPRSKSLHRAPETVEEEQWQEFESAPEPTSEPAASRIPPENASAIADNNRAMHEAAAPFQAHCQQPDCAVCEGHMTVMSAS
jgi:hypothetical protein